MGRVGEEVGHCPVSFWKINNRIRDLKMLLFISIHSHVLQGIGSYKSGKPGATL
jgi:hypothetical protein